MTDDTSGFADHYGQSAQSPDCDTDNSLEFYSICFLRPNQKLNKFKK